MDTAPASFTLEDPEPIPADHTAAVVGGLYEKPNVTPASYEPPAPKKSHKKIIGAVLVLIGLVISIPAGVLLTQRNQDTRKFAKGNATCGNRIVEEGEQCDDGNQSSQDGCSELCRFEQRITPPAVETSAQIKIYKLNGEITDPQSWHELTPAEQTALSSGDIIYISVSAEKKTDIYPQTRARIGVNVGDQAAALTSLSETSDKKPKASTADSDEYYIIYTIPKQTAIADLHISAQMYTAQNDDNANPSDSNNGWK